MNLFVLVWSYLKARPLNTILNILLLAMGIGVITTLLLFNNQFQEKMSQNSRGIDLVVVYFTLRLASLTLADWRSLPPVPMIAFLAIVKVSYFSVFTAVGGQTIGKMAAGIRVITDERGLVDPARAVRRTLAGAVSFVTLGVAFIPALFGADRRALHDRLAHTRVVALPSGQF